MLSCPCKMHFLHLLSLSIELLFLAPRFIINVQRVAGGPLQHLKCLFQPYLFHPFNIFFKIFIIMKELISAVEIPLPLSSFML